MSITEIHEHQWCYHGDLLVGETSHHRQEWCVLCGTTRVYFKLGWAYQYPDWLRQKLETGEVIEKDRFIGKIPERAYRIDKGRPPAKRLGRGLRDLLDQNATVTPIRGLFPKKED